MKKYLVLAFLVASCGVKPQVNEGIDKVEAAEAPSQNQAVVLNSISDEALSAKVDEFKAGKLIESLNAARSKNETQLGLTNNPAQRFSKPQSFSPSSSFLMGLMRNSSQNALQGDLKNPCTEIPKDKKGESDSYYSNSIKLFAKCMSRLSEKAHIYGRLIDFHKAFIRVQKNTQSSSRAFHLMSIEEILDFISVTPEQPDAYFLLISLGSKYDIAPRVKYTEEELFDLLALISKQKEALLVLSKQLASVVTQYPHLFKYFSSIDRYRAIIAYQQFYKDFSGISLAEELVNIFSESGVPTPTNLEKFPNEFLIPYALLSLFPNPSEELLPLNPMRENPFARALDMSRELVGDEFAIKTKIENYLMVLARDNPKIPSLTVAPAKDAVKVAVLDTGIDFETYPDLGLFLGNGKNGQLSQLDITDGDNNPWVIGVGLLEHGSGTMATVLTVLSHFQPEVLKNRKLDLASWKVGSLKSLLVGSPYNELSRFDPFHLVNFVRSVIETTEMAASKKMVAPDIVSVSAAFPLRGYIEHVRKPTILTQSPWLWVMAAGNESTQVEEANGACFLDIPEENKKKDHVLCVGALKQGIINDQIAEYSNYGDAVDVYSYESFIGLCPNGTSCSTPAITAAAAALKAKYPSLLPKQLKEIIIEASEWRVLEVERTNFHGLPVQGEAKKVRVFDPRTMMDRAFDVAKTKVRKNIFRRILG